MCSSKISSQKEQFLDHLLTGGEKWVVVKRVVRKRLCLQRGDTTVHIQSWLASEEDYVCWWDREGIVHYELLKENSRYCFQFYVFN